MARSTDTSGPDGRWFGDTFRKVHTLYVSPAWARDRGVGFDAARTADQLAAADVDCVELYAKDHHGVCYYPASAGLPYPRDVVTELCEAVQARGMRFIAYFSVCFDTYALGVHPEWRATGRDGEARRQPPFFYACLRSGYHDYALEQVRELITSNPIDGLWLDIVPFAWDSPQDVWMQTALPAPCYCVACQAAFAAETGFPLPRGTETLSPERQRAAYEFVLTGARSFVEEARRSLRAVRPEALLTYNGANGPGDPLALGDLVSIEGHAPHYARQSFIGAWARGVGIPFEILTAGGTPASFGGWNGFDQKPPPVLAMEAALGAANGGSAVIGHTPYPDGTTAAGQFSGFAAAFSPLKQLEAAMLTHPASIAEVAIVLSTKPARAPESWAGMTAAAEAVYRALLNIHIPADVLPRADDLAHYQLVVLADQVALDQAEVDAIGAFVTNGGALLVIGATGSLDDDARAGQGGPLDDVLGIESVGPAGWPFSYLRLGDGPLADGIPDVPVLINRDPVRIALRGAEVLGELSPPETGRTDATTVLWGNPPPDFARTLPGVTLHRAGSGRAVSIACSLADNRSAQTPMWGTRGLEDAWLQRLLQNAARFLLPTQLVRTEVPPGVHLTLNKHDGKLAVHLIDTRLAEPEHIAFSPEGAASAGWTLALNRARIGAITAIRTLDGQPVEWSTTGDEHIVRLPPIARQTVLVIETGA